MESPPRTLLAVTPLPSPRHHSDFSPESLAKARKETGLSVSVCLPARNEDATVGEIVSAVRRCLFERFEVIDEIVVIDDGSSDSTAEAAASAGARVVLESSILPSTGSGPGKGNALWKSLHACRGDLICWVDADIRNFEAHFVAGLIGPLLTDPEIGFVKGFYQRPVRGESSGGGRVTELVARPLISLLFPQLTRFVQPLSGEYAGRRAILESIPFVRGWGVEFGMLLDIIEKYGDGAIAQVDLGVREHRNRPLDQLSIQATAVIATALRRAGIDPSTLAETELTRFTENYTVERIAIETSERPPMNSIAEYLNARKESLS